MTAQLNDSERVTDGVSFDVWNIEWIHWCEEYRAGSLPQTDVKDNKTSKPIQFTSVINPSAVILHRHFNRIKTGCYSEGGNVCFLNLSSKCNNFNDFPADASPHGKDPIYKLKVVITRRFRLENVHIGRIIIYISRFLTY